MPTATDGRAAPLPVLALTFNALTWGLSWWAFRQLETLGLHPLWATVLIYLVAVGAITVWRPQAWRELLRTPALWVLVFAAGTTNAAFNWGVTIGDVVRVVLMFYLMPLWAVVLARWLLGERLTWMAGVRIVLALTGAFIVLWPVDGAGGLPLPRSLPEWLGVLGGFTFALNNVMLRREARRSDAARAVAMFAGGAMVSGVAALTLSVQPPPALAPAWVVGALALAACFLAGNLALQYGAARLPANITAVVMITEVFFASASAVLLGASVFTPMLAIGGLLIVGASLLAARH